MMRLGRTAALLVAFLLLTTAAPAYAECAWVFWQEAIEPQAHEPSTWPVSAWETKSACEQALAKKMASDTASSSKAKDTEVIAGDMGGKPAIRIRTKGRPDLGITAYMYVCFLDTVDPRGPKGK
jgi:hypothetical protein